MTRDDIVLLARKADLWITSDERIAAVVRFAELVANAEREACAQVCDDWPNGRDDVYLIGKAIRARGEK